MVFNTDKEKQKKEAKKHISLEGCSSLEFTVGGTKFEASTHIDHPNKLLVHIEKWHDECFVDATTYKPKEKAHMVRLLKDLSTNTVHVAGYLERYCNINKEEYGLNEERLEQLKIVPESERIGLEEQLKKTYKNVVFWG